MKNHIYIPLLSIFFFATTVFSQVNETDAILSQTFGNKSEIYFSFTLQDSTIMLQLTRIVSIDNVKQNEVIAVANKKQFELFLEYNIPYIILPSANDLLPPEAYVMTDNMLDKTTYAWDAYPTYQAYIDMMMAFQTNYPSICKIDTIGFTVEGRILIAARISDNVNQDEFEPEFLYTSSMHGDEITAYVLMLRLIDYLLTSYGTVTRVTNMINSMEIYINPLANPDGTYIDGNHTVANAQRYNANNEDLNRNYPCPDGDQHPDGAAWQIETLAFMDWADERSFVMSANFHGGAELMNYPWDYTLTNHPDKQWWIYVSKEYADTAQANSPAGYFDDNGTGFDYPGVTEGASWYYAFGSRQDYMQNNAFCREVTNEISSTKMPSAASLPSFWNYNWKAFLNYIEQGSYGFKGIVTDGCTGLPMKAKIELVGWDAQNSFVYSSLPVGNYHRPVKAGTYTIKASAPGYIDQTYTNVTIADKSSITRNFTLTPPTPDAQFISSNTESCDGIVEFVNNSTAGVDVVYTWDFGDGTQSTDTNPIHIYANDGNYTVKLIATSCSGVDSLIRVNYIDIQLVTPPAVSDESRCGAGTLTLTTASPGTIYWWDATGTNLLFTGSSYTTPSLTQTTDYQVSLFDGTINTYYGGQINKTVNGGYYSLATEHGLFFNCTQAVTLKSVKVYSNQAGNRTITLQDANEIDLDSVVVNIPNGESRITLNIELPVGNGLRLIGPETPNLWRDGTSTSPNLAYPFNIGGVISITGNTASDAGYYYYFYDWEIELIDGCESQKTPVQAIIYSTPSAAFTWVENSFTVTFTNTSTGGGTYLWDFGDGFNSTDENPIHTYASGGSFNVSLTITNDCGQSTHNDNIVVSTVSVYDLEYNIQVYPNPASETININAEIEMISYKLFDVQGKLILSGNINNHDTQIDINSIQKGTYLLQIITKDYTAPFLILKE